MAQERFLDDRMPDIMAQWRHYFELLGVCAGEAVIDVGSDTGDAARFLASARPDLKSIVCIESSQKRVMRAVNRWQSGGADARIAFSQADALALPSADAQFERAICAEMLEFVPQPVDALREIRRVLKPNGAALVVHTDWETQVFATRDRVRSRRIVTAFAGDGPGGDIGRRLFALCRAAGFDQIEASVFTLVNTEWRDDHYGPKIVALMEDWLRQTASISPEELAAWRADIDAAVMDGSFLYAVNRFVCRCTKH